MRSGHVKYCACAKDAARGNEFFLTVAILKWVRYDIISSKFARDVPQIRSFELQRGLKFAQREFGVHANVSTRAWPRS